MAPVRSILIERFKRLPRRSDETWQGGLVRTPMWVDGPDGTPRRPTGAVWVSRTTGLVNVKLESEFGAADDALALDSLLELGLKFASCRPARLEVADEALGKRLVETLGDGELATIAAPLSLVTERLREMADEMETTTAAPDALWARGVTIERMRAFAVAARQFYQAAPWRFLSDEDLIEIEAPLVPRGLRHLTVLGAAGHTFGLGFYATPRDFERVMEGDDAGAFVGRNGAWCVLYGPLWELPFGDVELWEEHDLAVAGERAYPLAVWFGPDGDIRRPEAPELAFMEAALRALAQSGEDEIDRGRWGHDVETADGSRRITFSIPELLAPLEAPASAPRRGAPDRRALERLMVEVHRFVGASEFKDEAEMQAAVQQRFSGSIDDVPSTAETPQERAQDLVFRAFEARGRRRIQLARKALAIWAECADGYTVLAEAAPDVERALDLYGQGVIAAERALGPGVFAEEAGHFWQIIQTRPYMRARFGLAQCLEAAGRRAEAIGHYHELMRLNPNDNQAVRYPLLAVLLLEGRDADAAALLDRYAGESSVFWSYGHALAAFRLEPGSRAAHQRLQQAVRENRHVPRYLAGDRRWSGPEPDAYAPGSREEAVIYADQFGEAWRATPGAIAWLTSAAPRPKSGKRKR